MWKGRNCFRRHLFVLKLPRFFTRLCNEWKSAAISTFLSQSRRSHVVFTIVYSIFDMISSFPAAVVIAFFLCWAPFHAQRLGYVYFKESHVFRTINEYLMYLSGICYYVSSTINPILYNVMSAKYRQAFRKTLCGMTQGTPGVQLPHGAIGVGPPRYGSHKSNGHQLAATMLQNHHDSSRRLSIQTVGKY